MTSSLFKIKVYENIYDEDGKIASPQYSDLQRELDKIHAQEEAIETAEESRKKSEQIRKDNESERTSNEEQRKQAETERIKAENQRTTEENKRQQQEATRVEAENQRITNETKRQNDTATAISNTEKATKNANDAATNANNATNDLQAKLASHHFVLTEDKDVAGGVPSLNNDAKIPISELYEATTTSKGITQLTDSVTSISTTTAATPKSVKTTYDAVITEKNRATNAENTITDNLNDEIARATASESNINETLTSHIANKSNPHNVTKSQIGLSNVDNTSDINKPVSTAQQSAIDLAYSNSNEYTDAKIADLINGAPSTLDTLGEIAIAMTENKNVVDALNEAIGIKANQSELDTHIGNNTIHITSTERANWNFAKTHADSAHAPSNAQANVIETVKVNGTALTPSSKSVNITVPTNNNQLTNGAGYITSSGTAKTISDTLPISKGGTGQTTAQEAANSLINSLSTGTATPTDADYYVCQYVGGGTTQTPYHRRPMSSLWEYIKSKTSSVLGLTSTNYTGNSATATKLATARTIALTGSVTGSGTFDGSGNLSISTTTNHTHSYLPLSGGNMTETIISSKVTTTYLAGNQGASIINSTASAGAYVMLAKMNSTNGYFTIGSYQTKFLLQYTTATTVTAGTNSVTKSVTLLDESGNSSFPGTVTASAFSGNASTATALTTSAGSATQPVYFSGGKPVACTYTLSKSVPSNAVFTDTTYGAATTSANGLMTAAMVTKLNGIASGANNYTLPTASSSTLGGVKTTSTVTSTSGLSPCPIISGVPYYKDANTTSDYEEGNWTPQIGYSGESSYYYLHDGKYKKIGNVVFLTCLADHFKADGNDTVYIAKSSLPFTMAADGFICGQINNTYSGNSGLVSYSNNIQSFICPSKSFSSNGPSTYTISIVYTI